VTTKIVRIGVKIGKKIVRRKPAGLGRKRNVSSARVGGSQSTDARRTDTEIEGGSERERSNAE